MKVWWDGISLRERLIVLAAGLVLIYILLDLVLIQPYQDKSELLKEQVVQAQEDLHWMQQAIQKLPNGSVKTSTGIRGSIVTYIDGLISRSGLKKNLQQMTPIQKNSVRVRLSDLEFNQLLKFLVALDNSILIEEIRILPQSGSGIVNASLILINSKAPS